MRDYTAQQRGILKGRMERKHLTERQQITNGAYIVFSAVQLSLQWTRFAPINPLLPLHMCVTEHQQHKDTHSHTCSPVLSAKEVLAQSDPKGGNEHWVKSANEAWWTATFILLYPPHPPTSHPSACLTLSLAFPPVSLRSLFPPLLNTFGLIVCRWLKLSQASAA